MKNQPIGSTSDFDLPCTRNNEHMYAGKVDKIDTIGMFKIVDDEKFIQISIDDDDYLNGLTNHGRIFERNRDGVWHEVELPDFKKI